MRPMSQMDLFDSAPQPQPDLEGGWPLPELPDPPGLLLGSCAWNHNSFDRHFYPKGLPSADQLAFYARRFNAVELDSSFYRVPTRSTVERWCSVVPEGFRFAVKAPRSVTHDGGLALDQPEARRDWEEWIDRLWTFGRHLSSGVVQLGPRSTVLQFARLRALLDTVAPAIPLAIEFRHPTWNDPEVHAWLRERGAVRAWVDHYNDPTRGVSREAEYLFEATGPFRYVRLLGDVSTKYNPAKPDGRNFSYGSVLFDRTEDLGWWMPVIARELKRGIPVHLFINNHYQGFTPITAGLVRKALGMTVPFS